MQKGYAKKLCAAMASVTAMMLVTGFGNLKVKDEPESARAPAISLADVRHGEIFIPEEQPQSLLWIDVTKAGRVSIADVEKTKAGLLAEIEKRVEKYGKNFSVMIAADKDAQYKDVANVLNLCVDAGVRGKVSFLGMRNRHRGIPLTLEAILPDPGQDEVQVASPITIQIGPDRRGVRRNRKFVSFEELDSDFKEDETQSRDVVVLLVCTPDAPHENLMRVLDICREYKVACRLAAVEKNSLEERRPPIEIQIGANTQGVLFDRSFMSFKTLDSRIKELSKVSTETPVLVWCTQDSPHGALVRVLDICYKYKMYKLMVLSM